MDTRRFDTAHWPRAFRRADDPAAHVALRLRSGRRSRLGAASAWGLVTSLVVALGVVQTEQGDPISAMKGDLRRLVSANEVYHVKTNKYASAVSALPGFASSLGITITILNASPGGWSAKATSTGLPGKSCVIYVGTVGTPPKTDSEGRTGSEAVAVCDKA